MVVLSPDAPPALPFWIDGRAVLTLGEGFIDVLQSGSDGPVLRRLPVCGPGEAGRAAVAARAAQPLWQGRAIAERMACLSVIASELSRYASHFSELLAEEAGLSAHEAALQVTAARDDLESVPGSPPGDRCVLVRPEGGDVFSGLVRTLSAVLAAGGAVVVLSNPRAPSALLALAELASRCGIPDGVFNLVHGDDGSARAIHQALTAGISTSAQV